MRSLLPLMLLVGLTAPAHAQSRATATASVRIVTPAVMQVLPQIEGSMAVVLRGDVGTPSVSATGATVVVTTKVGPVSLPNASITHIQITPNSATELVTVIVNYQ